MGSMVASFGSYLFQLFMGRMLSVVHYGELQSLLSVFVLISIPSAVVVLVVAKYFASHNYVEDFAKMRGFLKKLTNYFFILGLLIFVFVLIFSGVISDYLQIAENYKIILMSTIMIFCFLSAMNKGVIQGFQQFNNLSLIGIVETFVKLVLGVFLVWYGWHIYGAIVATVISALVGYLYSLYPVKKTFALKDGDDKFEKIEPQELKNLINYILPVFFSLFASTCFFSLDVILTKHFFTPEEAGGYGGVAVLGKMIYFATAPLASVLFSISAKEHSEGKNYHKSFLLSFAIISLIGLGSVFVFFSFPNLIINSLLGKNYLHIAVYVGWYAISITILSLINLVVNFLLSIKMTNCVYLLLVGVALQYFGIVIWHESIKQVITVNGIVMGLILVSLLLYYYFFDGKKVKKIEVVEVGDILL
jgi:O-antigen/teichoic acid export membrane protein